MKGRSNPQKRWLIIVFLLIATNIVFLVFWFLDNNLKQSYDRKILLKKDQHIKGVSRSDYYDLACPDIDLVTTENKIFRLREFSGEVIILRFTRFHPQDIPYLIYLEHLYNVFKREGIHLFFIQLLGKKISENTNEKVIFSVPIVQDDGFIASAFQAELNDTIIIGRDLRIKFKNNQAINRIIYNQTLRNLLSDSRSLPSPKEAELESLLRKISYKNIKNEKIEHLKDVMNNGPSIINIFISLCFSCPEQGRIGLIKDIASKTRKDDLKAFLLFGKGNAFSIVREFFDGNNFSPNLTGGIILNTDNFLEEDYYKILRLDVDPRLFIFNNKGKLTGSVNFYV
jgi:hypothetical protein